MRYLVFVLLVSSGVGPVVAATIEVPRDQATIQAAIDSAASGDTIVVAPGTYRERLVLKPGVRLRSAGDDTRGTLGLRRAEVTVLDGAGNDGKTPGVAMAEASSLDGFTITNVGLYDDSLWKKHYDSQGEELGDEEGAARAEGTIPAIRIHGVNCSVSGCIVHHNGDVGIAILGGEASVAAPLISGNLVYRNLGGGIGVAEGAQPIVRGNICRENLRAGIGCRGSNPVLVGNECYQNVRAGIGCREGSRPLIQANKCYRNRRAGIGIRMAGSAPVVEGNECFENDLAGIGCRDEASPIVRNNVCRKNKLAGIGCRDGAKPLIVSNECRENLQAGIGVQAKATAIIVGNQCVDNQLVAIGVSEEASATIAQNELSRSGGAPPIVAIRDGSTATIRDNRIAGGGVAAVLVQGKATLSGNSFAGVGEQQGNAIWVWEKSTASIADNSFDGYRAAVSAAKATVVVTGNTIKNFRGTAIVVRDSQQPSHVYGNQALSLDPNAKIVEIQGRSGIVEENVLRRE